MIVYRSGYHRWTSGSAVPHYVVDLLYHTSMEGLDRGIMPAGGAVNSRGRKYAVLSARAS